LCIQFHQFLDDINIDIDIGIVNAGRNILKTCYWVILKKYSNWPTYTVQSDWTLVAFASWLVWCPAIFFWSSSSSKCIVSVQPHYDESAIGVFPDVALPPRWNTIKYTRVSSVLCNIILQKVWWTCGVWTMDSIIYTNICETKIISETKSWLE